MSYALNNIYQQLLALKNGLPNQEALPSIKATYKLEQGQSLYAFSKENLIDIILGRIR